MKKIEYSKSNPKRTAGNEMFLHSFLENKREPKIRKGKGREAV